MTRGKAAETDVTYIDGRVERVTLRSSAWIAVERRWKVGVVPAIESIHYATWVGLNKPGNGADDDARFDDWCAGVESLDDVTEEAAADPTQPGPEPG